MGVDRSSSGVPCSCLGFPEPQRAGREQVASELISLVESGLYLSGLLDLRRKPKLGRDGRTVNQAAG